MKKGTVFPAPFSASEGERNPHITVISILFTALIITCGRPADISNILSPDNILTSGLPWKGLLLSVGLFMPTELGRSSYPAMTSFQELMKFPELKEIPSSAFQCAIRLFILSGLQE